MAISIEDIAPKVSTTPTAPATTTTAPVATAVNAETNTGSTIPDAVLEIPAFSALLKGSPPAVFAAKNSALPEVKTIQQNIKPLLDSGFGVYATKDGSGSVLFNLAFISPEEVKAADNAGKLPQLAPPVEELVGFFNQELSGGSAQPAAAPVSANTAPPAPAAAQNRTQNARVSNLANVAPTSGIAPGQGRVLNAILQPTV